MATPRNDLPQHHWIRHDLPGHWLALDEAAVGIASHADIYWG